MKSKTPDPKFADWEAELPATHNRVAQFMKKEQLTVKPLKAGTPLPKCLDVENPYLKARLKILSDYKEWRRNEILEMERTMNIDNPHYDSFVHEVAILGDTYMPIHTVTF